MCRVIVNEWMTLDGVVQAPISPGEDTDGGFAHGGWHVPHTGDETFRSWATESIAGAGGFLLGRRTYEHFAAHWPNASPEEQDLAGPLNARPKYVASTTLAEPLAWQHSTLLRGNVAEAVAALKRESGAYLLVIGSTELLRTLVEHDLVDEYRLMVFPVVLGSGKRVFPETDDMKKLELVDLQNLGGIQLQIYKPAS